jgi:hypothetical protein
MKRKDLALIAFILLWAMAGSVIAQSEKKWTDWNKKEAQKMLQDSPWAKTQVETDTSEMMYSPTAGPGTSRTNADRARSGATNSAINLNFQIRFFSARPIRQALARMIEISQNLDPKTQPDMVTKLQNFAELKSSDSIIVTVTFDSPDGRYSGPAFQALSSAVTATVRNDSYLQRSDGKQLFLDEYVPPGKDGFGARFIFKRELDGKPFIDEKSGEIRFYAKLPNIPKLDRRFKVADMMYQGALEY